MAEAIVAGFALRGNAVAFSRYGVDRDAVQAGEAAPVQPDLPGAFGVEPSGVRTPGGCAI